MLITIPLLIGASLGFWVRAHLLDADRFADAAVAVLHDPGVEKLLVERATDAALEAASRETKMPLQGFRAPVRSGVEQALADERAKQVLREALVLAHQAVFDDELKDVVIDLHALAPQVQAALQAADPRLASQIPELEELDVPVLRGADLPSLAGPASMIRTYVPWAVGAAGVGLILFIVLFERKSIALIIAGVVVAVIAAAELGLTYAFSNPAMAFIPDEGVRVAARAVGESLFGGLRTQSLYLLGAGVAIAALGGLMAAVSGPRRATPTY